ncbi:uncharacterized protein LOC108627909 [Ceratina calcarata]|uniref:Uncharacterized protein LOC108627909 n=1 Tax=Ceratina calcarata TaxID=156304 RepID=A0AAJ7J4Z2_9HYME|nr:uncharacterized protein LOC108627909 [Ceratina calcarata]XP_026671633.1 uncharacterized protein LOC108627909 [Ceratina calcarata]
MEDQELKELKELKTQLVEKASKLLTKLKDQEENQKVIKIKESNVTKSVKEKLPEEYNKLSVCSKEVSGIAFKNIDRKWIHDNIYKYTTSLISESLNVDVELIVKLECDDKSEVCDLACNFKDLHQCYMFEVDSWYKFVIRKKNFSLLTSGIFQYNERNLVRRRLLNKLKDTNYISYEECLDKHGGILIHVHSPRSIAREYLTCQWVIAFTKRCWQLENHFNIDVTETEFAERNNVLLANFVRKNTTKEELTDSWSKLCFAIDLYESEEQVNTGSS